MNLRHRAIPRAGIRLPGAHFSRDRRSSSGCPQSHHGHRTAEKGRSASPRLNHRLTMYFGAQAAATHTRRKEGQKCSANQVPRRNGQQHARGYARGTTTTSTRTTIRQSHHEKAKIGIRQAGPMLWRSGRFTLAPSGIYVRWWKVVDCLSAWWGQVRYPIGDSHPAIDILARMTDEPLFSSVALERDGQCRERPESGLSPVGTCGNRSESRQPQHAPLRQSGAQRSHVNALASPQARAHPVATRASRLWAGIAAWVPSSIDRVTVMKLRTVPRLWRRRNAAAAPQSKTLESLPDGPLFARPISGCTKKRTRRLTQCFGFAVGSVGE